MEIDNKNVNENKGGDEEILTEKEELGGEKKRAKERGNDQSSVAKKHG